MAKNTGRGHRQGSVTDRSQVQLPNGHWAKRNTETGRILDVKSDDKPFRESARRTRPCPRGGERLAANAGWQVVGGGHREVRGRRLDRLGRGLRHFGTRPRRQ